MAYAVFYEWDIETVDLESGDILDHDHCDLLSEYHTDQLLESISGDGEKKLVLVRDEEDGYGNPDRLWAYAKNGKMPEVFSDSLLQPTMTKVPIKFLAAFYRQIKLLHLG